MRTLSIPSTKAAYDRLRLMRDPENLAIPFDAEAIAPFGLRHLEGETLKNGMRITYRGQDIGVIGDHDGAGFMIKLAAPPSERVDAAVRHVFSVIERHLNRVGTIMAAEKKIRRGSPEYAEMLERKAQQTREAEERKRAQVEAQDQARERKRRESMCGLGREDETDRSPVLIEGFAADDIMLAARFKAPGDLLEVHMDRFATRPDATFIIGTREGARWTFIKRGQAYEMSTHAGQILPDPQRLREAMGDLIARNRQIADPDRVQRVLRSVVPTEMSVERYGLHPEDVYIYHIHSLALQDLGEDAQLMFRNGRLHLDIQGARVASWSVHQKQTEITEIVKLEDASPMKLDVMRDPDILSAIGSVWVNALVQDQSRPVNPDLFRRFQVNDLEEGVSAMDFGYDL